MGKKKRLENIDEYEMGVIDSKMNKTITLDCSLYESQSPSLKNLSYKIDIKCKNKKQKECLQMLKDETKEICIIHGSAGTGKSYLSLSYALQALKDESTPYEKIIILVPTLQSVSATLSIGLLKGTIDEKIAPFLEADSYTIEKILKNSGNSNAKIITESLINTNKIEFKLCNFARGLNYDQSIILINEAEGYSADEMLLLLTRANENSKVIISGDEAQAIRKDFKNGSGMKYAIEKLSHLQEVGIFEFTNDDIVRNPLITKILDCWK